MRRGCHDNTLLCMLLEALRSEVHGLKIKVVAHRNSMNVKYNPVYLTLAYHQEIRTRLTKEIWDNLHALLFYGLLWTVCYGL
jgi:hypothetical protein